MKFKNNSLFWIGITFITVIFVTIYFLFKLIFSFTFSIDSKTATSLLSITIPLVASIITVYLGRLFEKQKNIQEKLRENKTPVYDEFISKSIGYLIDKEKQKDIDGLSALFKNITPKIIIWGDDKVLKAYADFRVNENPDDAVKVALKYQNLLLAIRKDLGHANSGLNNNELLKCFINDVDVFLKNNASNHKLEVEKR